MLRQLDYQERVLSSVDHYLDVLNAEKAQSDKAAKIAAEHPDVPIPVPDFAAKTWEAMQSAGRLPVSRATVDYSPRHDGMGQPVPNIVLKVPTGGGKTFIAVNAISRIQSRYLGTSTGFVLWIVPNEAIYAQTLKHLKDRQHAYRQTLDRAAAGRVKIMEKDDRLDARDVESNLCVMLLMLQSANRQTQESLRMFRDRGDVFGFCPPEGDQGAHAQLIEGTPNLDSYIDMFPMVKDSLGNALRIIRPLVVMDEGQKATSDLAFSTLYGFNPCFVLELTATPKDIKPRGGQNPRPGRNANVLVEVTGKELDREEMIKMPLILDPRQGDDWKATLNAGLERLNSLGADAEALRSNTNRYIRPIMLVQVERTGRDQRDGAHIHAEDVKEWLLTAGFDEDEIAIKTAEQNDLNQPENIDLLAPTNRVRGIITKQALQEGWDCPFAYVLCSLSASSNISAMTQLVGRILRQPHALKTGIEGLDQCYVITHHAQTADVVSAVKKGLESDGLGDLMLEVVSDDMTPNGNVVRKIDRRPELKSDKIYLPRVMLVEGDEVRNLDYDTDILSAIDWRGFDSTDIANSIPENLQPAENQLQRISLTDDEEQKFVQEIIAASTERFHFDPAHAVRLISDIVLNPFVGREIIGKLLDRLRARGFEDKNVGEHFGLIVETLRKGLEKERRSRSEAKFKADVASGRIQFRLRVDGRNWQMPSTMETNAADGADQLVGKDGGPLKKSLFSPMYRDDLNKDERDIAIHLDAEETLNWWHRNVARSQYGLQGWRRGKIYPDFIFAVQREKKGARITVLETKGDQLSDNLDTQYKREVLEFLSSNFAWDKTVNAGEFELVTENGETVECALVLMSEWETKLPAYLAS